LKEASKEREPWEAGARWPYEPGPRTGPDAEPSTHLRVLDEIVHAFASATDAEEAYAGTTKWVREALEDPQATVRVVLPDRRGRLRLAFSDGPSAAALRSASARQEVLRTKRPSVAAGSRSGGTVVRIPLVTRGEAVGILELVTAAEELDRAMNTLRAVASQAAIVFGNLRHRTEQAREIAVRGSLAALSHQLVGARSRETALDTAAKFCAEQLHVPAAAWLFRGDDRGMELVTAHGLGDPSPEALASEMGWIPHWDTLPTSERRRQVGVFAGLASAEDVSPVGVGDVLFLAGGPRSGLLAVVEGLLEEILTHLTSVARAHRRNEQLDVALAWTAHEFRAPLLGVKAMVEHLLEGDGDARSHRATLQDLQIELQELVALVEPVLQWAAGAVPLERQMTDVVALTRDATGSTGADGRRIDISGADEAIAPVDGNHLRTAISNLIRNAMAYSPADSEVAVTVTVDEESVTISVADRGPGVPASERDEIFDPFMRGQVGQSTRYGKGLGLFVARRVVEAHDGKIWVESPDGEGAIFHLSVPVG
jgi:signal transduction histidine kinase